MGWQDYIALGVVALAAYGIWRRMRSKKKGACENCGDE